MKFEYWVLIFVVASLLAFSFGMWWHYYVQYNHLVQGMKDRDTNDKFDDLERKLDESESHFYRSMDSLEERMAKINTDLNHRIDLIDAKHEAKASRRA